VYKYLILFLKLVTKSCPTLVKGVTYGFDAFAEAEVLQDVYNAPLAIMIFLFSTIAPELNTNTSQVSNVDFLAEFCNRY